MWASDRKDVRTEGAKPEPAGGNQSVAAAGRPGRLLSSALCHSRESVPVSCRVRVSGLLCDRNAIQFAFIENGLLNSARLLACVASIYSTVCHSGKQKLLFPILCHIIFIDFSFSSVVFLIMPGVQRVYTQVDFMHFNESKELSKEVKQFI